MKYRRVTLKGWNPWLMFYWADKDGSPVLKEQAVWWKHIHGVVIARKHEIIFRHHEKEWDWQKGKYKS